MISVKAAAMLIGLAAGFLGTAAYGAQQGSLSTSSSSSISITLTIAPRANLSMLDESKDTDPSVDDRVNMLCLVSNTSMRSFTITAITSASEPLRGHDRRSLAFGGGRLDPVATMHAISTRLDAATSREDCQRGFGALAINFNGAAKASNSSSPSHAAVPLMLIVAPD